MKSTKTPVRDGDTILVLPAVRGGAVALREPQTSSSGLSQEEIRRYGRHLIMPEVGMEGQRKLKGAKVLLIGTGGLGSPLSLYLAAAGVGRIGLVDFDLVDQSNLQRQVIFSVRDVGRPKLEAAKRRIVEINPNIQVDTYETRLNSENALAIIQSYDVVVDGTDNFPTATWLMTHVSYLANRTFTGAYSDLKVRFPSSTTTQGPATDACTLNRRRQA